MTPFGDLFTRYGSDKNTNHSYGPLYDALFPNRERVKSVLEIGIASGGCLLAWRDAFPNAQIVGFDKEPCHTEALGSEDGRIYPVTPRPDRIEIHQGDMRSREDLLRAVNGRTFDVIVEDATHLLEDNLRALFWLWPCLAPGGMYIVEEFANVQGYAECFGLFAGARLIKTDPPIADELLVVIEKLPIYDPGNWEDEG